MEGVDTALSKDVGMGGNQMIMTANMQMENRKMKMKNKKKRRRQSKNQLFNFSKTLKKVTFKKKIDSLKKAEEKEMQVREGQSNTEGVENIDQNTQKPKKPKLRNNRDFKFPSEKVSKYLFCVMVLMSSLLAYTGIIVFKILCSVFNFNL